MKRLSIVLVCAVAALFCTPRANGQTPDCPNCEKEQPQPWYGQQLVPPTQQAVPIRPAPPQVIVRPRAGHEAVVRVIVGSGFGRSHGSGAIVDATGPTATVLTAAHLFTDEHGRENHSDAIDVIVTGKCYKAKLLRPLDTTQDLAALKIANPNVGRVYIRKAALPIGSQAWAYGYGPLGSPYGGIGGRLVQMVSFDKGTTFDAGEYSLVARKGDSGGPILDKTGYLVGVISGEDGRTTCGAFFPRIRAFLRCVRPPYPNRPGVIIPKPIVVLPVRPPSPQPTPTPTPPAPVVQPTIDYKQLAVEVYKLIEANADKFRGPEGKQGPPGGDGPQGQTGGAGPTPAINIQDLAMQVRAELAHDALFYIVHKDPKTGELIPQRDPETGEMLTVQEIRRGDQYTIYLHRREDMQEVK